MGLKVVVQLAFAYWSEHIPNIAVAVGAMTLFESLRQMSESCSGTAQEQGPRMLFHSSPVVVERCFVRILTIVNVCYDGTLGYEIARLRLSKN